MSQPRDLYVVDAYGNYRPITAAAQGYAQQAQQYGAVSQYPPQTHQNAPQTQQNTTASHTYHAQERHHAATYHEVLGYPRTSSSHRAYQGSRSDTQQHEERVDPRDRVNFAGHQYQPDDRHQRTASFVQYRQRNHPGARYPPSAIEAERSGIRYAANSITSFDNQFSRTADINAYSPNIQRGDSPLTYAQRNNSNPANYPNYIEDPSQGNSWSRSHR
ncbi:hypothetical protein FSARC_1265 [Fusarium sarcochroum]|uniref:Uncharacterized protein n=1 Tax=Fusarium sarcochroum TaxID=1208366 RepID=A0A8H4XF50_9HYPO|nr:hypothetical protein FSARC_1265 [Fusarium sarcochroum]